jgi:hypothetical protein
VLGAAFRDADGSPKSEGLTLAESAVERARPWLWTADPERADDLASDMSRFHGIRDIGAMRSSALARLSLRIGAYGGALAAPRKAPVAAPQPPPERRRPDPGPVASAETLRRLLAPVPGSLMWGNVVTVPKEKQDPPPDASEPDGG